MLHGKVVSDVIQITVFSTRIHSSPFGIVEIKAGEIAEKQENKWNT